MLPGVDNHFVSTHRHATLIGESHWACGRIVKYIYKLVNFSDFTGTLTPVAWTIVQEHDHYTMRPYQCP